MFILTFHLQLILKQTCQYFILTGADMFTKNKFYQFQKLKPCNNKLKV